MGVSIASGFEVPLVCSSCQDQRTIQLDRTLFEDLGRQGQVRIFCAACGTSTIWRGAQADRRSGLDRRRAPQARLQLPIFIRCDHPAQQFSEVTTTQTASRKGASFCTQHQLREGMTISVVLPFKEGDPNPIESPARVAWLRPQQGNWEVGIELLR
jgi:hypothetical protein